MWRVCDAVLGCILCYPDHALHSAIAHRALPLCSNLNLALECSSQRGGYQPPKTILAYTHVEQLFWHTHMERERERVAKQAMHIPKYYTRCRKILLTRTCIYTCVGHDHTYDRNGVGRKYTCVFLGN